MTRIVHVVRTAALVVSVITMAWTGTALAHAELESARPAPESMVTESLGEIVLTFTEPVELHFSIFKVYRLEGDLDMSAETAWQRVNGLAGALVSEVLESREDGDARADLGVANSERQSREVVLALEEDLPPGLYVVMWRVLSVDTHAVQGFYVFDYRPGG